VARIEHVVVLMLENRSFDHLLGYLDHPDPDFEGVPAGAHNLAGDGRPVPASNLGLTHTVDPDHSHHGALRQLGSAGDVVHNGGFVVDYEARLDAQNAPAVMACLDPATEAPALARLAREFAVCDHWFSSVPGETWPNRHFAHAATSGGTVNIELGLYFEPTIFEQLDRRGSTWRIYYDGPPEAWAFPKLWRTRTVVDFLLRRPANRIGNWFEFPTFMRHVEDEDLPDYTFIEPAHNQVHSPPSGPRQTNSQHPHNNVHSSDDFREGDRLVARIYEALRNRPDLFATTLFVITYDEHGGLYDHVKPEPCTPPGVPSVFSMTRVIGRLLRRLSDRLHHRPPDPPFRFDQLGVRVPTILVSPWIKPGTLVPTVFDHSSIPATVRALFAPSAPSLTKRDKDAATFHGVVEDAPLTHPRPVKPGPDGASPLPDLSAEAAPRRVEAHGVATAAPGEAPTDDALHLDRLAMVVEAELARRPPPSPTTRRPPPGTRGPAEHAAPAGAQTGTGPVSTFARSARRARGSS
jgi:phospholipase C